MGERETEPRAHAAGRTPVVRARAHELVVEAIEDQIMAGTLTAGDPLPPERVLAAQLQVSRAGLREGIRVLEAQGVLRSSVGSGREAGTFVVALPETALTRLLRLHVALSSFTEADVIEARIMLERSSVALAVDRVDDEVLAAIRAPLARMDVPGISREEFNDADTDFHVAVAEAGGNRLVADMTAAIRASLRRPILRALQGVPAWDEVSGPLQHQHRGIYDAIVAGQGPRAAHLVEAHIRYAVDALPGLGGRRSA